MYECIYQNYITDNYSTIVVIIIVKTNNVHYFKIMTD